MKRLDLVVATSLAALAAFVASQALQTRQLHAERSHNGESVVTERSSGVTRTPERRARRGTYDDPSVEEVRRRIELSAPSTYIGDVLASHDSALARWAERRSDPLRVWIQPVARINDWSPASLPLVRDAFVEWGESGVPVKELYQLFPKGPAKLAAKIGGIPKPRGCI